MALPEASTRRAAVLRGALPLLRRRRLRLRGHAAARPRRRRGRHRAGLRAGAPQAPQLRPRAAAASAPGCSAIARNAALDELRRRRRDASRSPPSPPTSRPPTTTPRRPCGAPPCAPRSPRSTPRERELIALKFHAGLSNAEIAAVLRISPTNVSAPVCTALSPGCGRPAMRRPDPPLDPGVARELTQLEASLADDVRAVAPVADPRFLAALEERAADGFARPARGGGAGRPPRRRLLLALPVLALVLGAVVVAGTALRGDGDGDQPAPGATVQSSGPDDAGGGGADRAAPAASPAPSVGAVADRRVERAASVTLTPPADEIQPVADGVAAATTAAGGYVAGSQVTTGSGQGSAALRLRVPSGRLAGLLARLRDLAPVESLTQAADDITGPTGVAAERLADARAERRALLRALGRATTEREIATLRERLRLNRSRLAAAKGALEALRRRARLATVDVTLHARSGHGTRRRLDAAGRARRRAARARGGGGRRAGRRGRARPPPAARGARRAARPGGDAPASRTRPGRRLGAPGAGNGPSMSTSARAADVARHAHRRPQGLVGQRPAADRQGVQGRQPDGLGRGAHLLRDALAVPGAARAGLDPRPGRRPGRPRRRAARTSSASSSPRAPSTTLQASRSRTSPRTSSGAGLALVVGLALALWSASGYVGAFMRADNAIYEKQEGRPFWKLRPLQIARHARHDHPARASSLLAVVATGPLANAVGDAIGLGDTAVTVWNIAKWPVLLVMRDADARDPLPHVAEREAAGLPLDQPRARRRRRHLDRRVGAVRPLRRELRLLQQDLRHASPA